SDAYKSGDTSALDDRQKETLDMAKEVISDEIKKGADDYGKELAIYSYLTAKMKNDTGLLTVIPTSGEDSDNPYGVLKYHSAVCVGYATTFRLFMQMLDIDCKVVHSIDLGHSWNLVKLDGEWYHVDCYMDAGGSYLRSFNMNDELCAQSHDWNREIFPAATGLKHNPMVNEAKIIDDLYAIPAWFSKNIEKESDRFSCSFREDISPDDEASAKYIVDTIVNGLSWNGDSQIYYEYFWIKNEEGKYILCVFMNDDNELELDDEQREAAQNAIAEYFPDIQFDDMGGGDYYYDSEYAKG
ncbi:MAG: hypothetical protein IKI78_04895, partial [Clostridia bacterium]|nr:hypothetical protein [Clostridia bacterium]